MRIFSFAVWAILVSAHALTEPDDPTADARAALLASVRAYRAAPALIDTLTYVVGGSNADREPKRIEVRLGAGTDASVADALLKAVAVGRNFYVTKSDAPDKYVARPFSGDFGKSLITVAGAQSSLFEPPQIAMRSGKSLELCIESFRFNLLGPLKIVGFARGADERGRTFEEIRFTAENGSEEVRIDVKTKLLSSVRFSITPPGAPSGATVEIQGSFSPAVKERAAGVVTFDPRGRRKVSDLAALTSIRLRVGGKAPSFVLESPDGGRVSLADLSGRVAVLDFWATWCVPCWKTLQETQRLFDWAKSSGQAVSIYAVNTMEQFPTPEKRRERVAEFFKSQKLTVPTLLDTGVKVFDAFGSPGLPSIVILTPNGTIFRYHQGITPKLLKTLETEIREAAAAP